MANFKKWGRKPLKVGLTFPQKPTTPPLASLWVTSLLVAMYGTGVMVVFESYLTGTRAWQPLITIGFVAAVRLYLFFEGSRLQEKADRELSLIFSGLLTAGFIYYVWGLFQNSNNQISRDDFVLFVLSTASLTAVEFIFSKRVSYGAPKEFIRIFEAYKRARHTYKEVILEKAKLLTTISLLSDQIENQEERLRLLGQEAEKLKEENAAFKEIDFEKLESHSKKWGRVGPLFDTLFTLPNENPIRYFWSGDENHPPRLYTLKRKESTIKLANGTIITIEPDKSNVVRFKE